MKPATSRKGVGGRPIERRTRALYIREIEGLRRLSGAITLDDTLDATLAGQLVSHLGRAISTLQELVSRIPE